VIKNKVRLKKGCFWLAVVFWCHTPFAYGCEIQQVTGLEFISSNSFKVEEERYKLVGLKTIDEAAKNVVAEWSAAAKLSLIPEKKAAPDRYGRCGVFVVNEAGETLQHALITKGLAVSDGEHDAAIESGGVEKKVRKSRKTSKEKGKSKKEKSSAKKEEKFLTVSETFDNLGEAAVIEGVVQNIFKHEKGHIMLNFGEDWKTDFTVFIRNSSVKKFDEGYFDALKGKKIRTKGKLYEKNGPSISLNSKKNIEIIN
jgi:hypothetical protein